MRCNHLSIEPFGNAWVCSECEQFVSETTSRKSWWRRRREMKQFRRAIDAWQNVPEETDSP